MPNNIQTRRARIEDADLIIGFQCAMALETENKTLSVETVSSGVKGVMTRPELGFYVIAESDNKVAGSLLVTPEWSDWRNGYFWWVQSVYVAPKYRRLGIYRMLYNHVKQQAETEPNVVGFRLYVERDNITAQRAYENLGMHPAHYMMYEEMLDL